MNADELIATLELSPHPEGGHYRETWRHVPEAGGRGSGTAIYFLLRGGERSRWHRVDACEIWHHYIGVPLELEIREDGGVATGLRLGPDVELGARPQCVVPAGAWQTARPLSTDPEDFALVGCTVSPAFVFEGFELGPDEDAG